MLSVRAITTLKAASHSGAFASTSQFRHQSKPSNKQSIHQSNRQFSVARTLNASHSNAGRVGVAAAVALSLAVVGMSVASNDSAQTEQQKSNLPQMALPTVIQPTQQASKQSKMRKTAQKQTTATRPALPNPGKFDHTHQEASHLTNSQSFAGARLQAGFQMFPPATSPDMPHVEKQLMLMPAISLSPDGQSGMLNVRTELGHAHVLEGMVDTASNVVGKYKFIYAPMTFKSNYRFIQQQGEDLSFECDYRGSEFVAQAVLQSSFTEAILSYNQQVTPTISLGAQLHTVLPHVTFCNLTARYNSRKGDIATLSYKNGMAIASYFRSAYETPAHPMFPSAKLDLATEFRVATNNKQSEFAVGACLQHPTFKYTVMGSNDWTLSVLLEQSLGNLGMMFTLSGEAKFDGSNDAKFGVGLQMG